jgi:hypothetical protein
VTKAPKKANVSSSVRNQREMIGTVLFTLLALAFLVLAITKYYM